VVITSLRMQFTPHTINFDPCSHHVNGFSDFK
jgi:hypothetical protein